jgi:PPOX class probable F420-dependent enzyme
VDLDRARDYLRANRRAILATMRADGTPPLSPVLVAVDDAGRVVVSTREPAMKTRNVLRDPRAWVCAFPDTFFGGHVQVEGDVDVVTLPEAMDGLVDYYRRVAGEHDDWDDYRAAMQRDQRCLLRLSLSRAGPDVSG